MKIEEHPPTRISADREPGMRVGGNLRSWIFYLPSQMMSIASP